MKIVVPMAGRGSRYANHGFETPKPLIEIMGKPMILWALDGLKAFDFTELFIIVLEEHEVKFKVSGIIQDYVEKHGFSGTVQIVGIPEVTEGQLCTVLAAKPWINQDEDLLIAASDTYIISDLAHDIRQKPSNCAGIISVINLAGEQWSFAKTNEEGLVVAVAEKVRISDHASNGLYYFANGADFVSHGEEMIRNNERTRGEFFVIPVYQKMIDSGKKIMISHAREMWDLGTPEAKQVFENHFGK